MAKKYTCPPQKATADNTFSDNLVGFQLVAGGGLTQGNFEFTVGITEKSNRDFVIGSFSDPITLDSLGVKSVEESRSIIEKNFKVYPNFDLSQVSNFSQYGSLTKRLSVSITKIINFFPAALEVTFKSPNYTTGATATNISYNVINDVTYLEIDLARIRNPFDVDFTINAPRNISVSEIELSPLRDMTTTYTKYSLYISGSSHPLISMTPTDNLSSGTLKMYVRGNPFTGVTTTYDNFIIRPNYETTEMVFGQDFDEIERFLLNRLATPIYSADFQVVEEDNNGKYYVTTQSITWPLDGVWNLDIRTPVFQDYVVNVSIIAENFDSFKTNLINRFLTTGAFKDFDTYDQKISKVLELYGRSFDQVKKFIDALAYMNSVNYNVGNDIPSQLLKNLSQTLGWSKNISPITNENFLNSVFGGEEFSEFSGVGRGYTPDELNYQFYRNLILNSAYLFKSKGTRKSIEGLLRLVGAPDALVDFNEYIYVADQKINMTQFNQEFAQISGGTYSKELPVLEPTNTFKVQGRVFTGFTTETIIQDADITLEEFPIDINGYPRAPEDTDNFYFQIGAGWFESTPSHRSNEVFDSVNTTFTGQNPNYQTKLAPFTYGQVYLDRFRDFPYTDLGFTLTKTIDNKKSWSTLETGLRRNSDGNNSLYFVDDEKLVLNVKNVDLFLNPGQALVYDVWYTSSNYDYPIPASGLTISGNCYCPTYLNPTILDSTLIDPNPSQKTFFEFAQTFWQNMINVRDRQYITNGKTGGYPTLEYIYWKYLKSGEGNNAPNTDYTYQKMIDYISGLGDYWIRLVEQMVPATTIWNTGVRYENSVFHRQKFVWRRQRGCQIVPVPCNPCTLIGPIFTIDCPQASTTCNVYPWVDNPRITDFGSVLNQLVTNYSSGYNCDLTSLSSEWYVKISLGGSEIISYPFFNGVGLSLGGFSYPSSAQWLTALESQLDLLIEYGLDYYIVDNVVTIYTLTCDGANLNSDFKINVGINFNIYCS